MSKNTLQQEVLDDQVQVSADGGTVWVHATDGSTVGRFSKRFGMDVHTTTAVQMEGGAQCLNCTHEPGSSSDWQEFVRLMKAHYDIIVPADAITFEALGATSAARRLRP